MPQLNVRLKTTVVFAKNRIAKTTTVIDRGGSRSSKSHSISQLLTLRFLEGKSQRILVLRKSLPSARLSVLPMFKSIWSDLGLLPYFRENKQFLDFTFGRNYLHIGSLDESEKAKSTEWNVVWMEEANEFTYEDYMILKLRLSAKPRDQWKNQIFLSLNPVDEYSWVKSKVIDNPAENVTEIVSTYKDNPFLSEEYVNLILGLRDQDANFWRIYGEGQWGRLENIVYSNWNEVDEMPELEDVIYGLDFGYSQPTCLLKLAFVENDVWVKELLYETGLTNNDLISKLPLLIPNRSAEIWADSSYPSNIEEIFQAGWNVQPVVKSPFSVKNGISIVKTKRLHITSDSVNLLKEIRGYSYKKDKAGHVTDEPVKWNDHALDSMRYAIMSHQQGSEPNIRWIGGN